jgi:lipopolysaccharide assembly outer membrane protein LptD (OstA)
MNNYPSLRNLLISIFSVDVGLNETEEVAAFERVLSDNSQRREIEVELRQLFQDGVVSWVEFLENDEYVVYPADDEEDAKEYVVENLWNRVFPDIEAP